MNEDFSLGRGLEPYAMITASLLAAILLLGAPTPVTSAQPAPGSAAAPAAAPAQLKEIGRVRVSVCGNIVVHANSAISSALKNDTTLSTVVARLRTVDLEHDQLSFHHGLADLDALAAQLHENATRGNGEVQRLRDLAETTKDPERKADLHAFADALGGALYRQKQASADLGGLVNFLEARDMKGTPELDQMAGATGPATTGRNNGAATPWTTWADSHGSPRQMTEMAALDFVARQEQIAIDEGTAADHAEGAVSGC